MANLKGVMNAMRGADTFNKTSAGQMGYDNSRENIDPRIVTKAIIAEEGIIQSLSTAHLFNSNTISTGTLYATTIIGDMQDNSISTGHLFVSNNISTASLNSNTISTSYLTASNTISTGVLYAITSVSTGTLTAFTGNIGNLVCSISTGIGTSLPTEKLDVRGNIYLSGDVNFGWGTAQKINWQYLTGSDYECKIHFTTATRSLNISNKAADGTNAITFQTGVTPTTRLTIAAGGDINIPSTTASTSTTTGALTIAGGLGVAGATFSKTLTATNGYTGSISQGALTMFISGGIILGIS